MEKDIKISVFKLYILHRCGDGNGKKLLLILLCSFEVDLYVSNPEHRKSTASKFLLLLSRLSELHFSSGYSIGQATCSWHD